jgi:DNA-binding GntR family transcriptional regulator
VSVRDAARPPRGGLGEAAHAELRRLIVSGELAPGTRLLEQDCAARLGLSRTPVREAIGRLVSEGLVRRPPGGAPVVHRITADELVEILEVRRLLEVEAAGRAAGSAGRDELLALRRRFAAFLEGPAPDPEAHRAADDALHDALARMAGSRLMAEMVANLRLRTRVFDKRVVPERFEPGCREHVAVIDAVVRGDRPGAETAMRAHLDHVAESLLASLARLY